MFSTFSSLIGCCDRQSVLWLAAVRRTLSCGCACSSAPAPVLVFYHLSAWVAPADLEFPPAGEATPVRVKHRALQPLTFENTTWHDSVVCVWPPRVRSGSDRSMCVRRSSHGFGCRPPSSPASLRWCQEDILCPDWLVSLFQLGWCRAFQLQVSETSVAALQEEQLEHLYDTFKGTVHPKRAVLLPFMCPSSGVGNIIIMSSDLMNDQAFTFMHSAFAFIQSDLQKRNKRDSSKIQQYS